MQMFNQDPQSNEDPQRNETRKHNEGDYVEPYIAYPYPENNLGEKVYQRKKPKSRFLIPGILIIVLLFGFFAFYGHAPQSIPTRTVTQSTQHQKAPKPPLFSSLLGQKASVPENNSVITTSGSSCWISFGGSISVIKDDDGKNVTVSYQPPSEPEVPSNIGCPLGTEYSLTRESFEQSNNEYLAHVKAREEEKQTVTKILAKDYYGSPQPAEGFTWVTSMNLKPVFRTFDHTSVEFGNSCTIGYASDGSTQGGTIQERGKAPDGKILYEYEPAGETSGSECPKGTIFFEK